MVLACVTAVVLLPLRLRAAAQERVGYLPPPPSNDTLAFREDVKGLLEQAQLTSEENFDKLTRGVGSLNATGLSAVVDAVFHALVRHRGGGGGG